MDPYESGDFVFNAGEWESSLNERRGCPANETAVGGSESIPAADEIAIGRSGLIPVANEAVAEVSELSPDIGKGKQEVGESFETDIPTGPYVVATSVSSPSPTVGSEAEVEDPHANLDTRGR